VPHQPTTLEDPMDDPRFDDLTRRLHTRRTALTSIPGGIAALLALQVEEANAHNPIRACKPITDPRRRLACLRRARAHNRNKHSCKPKPAATFCVNRCGTTQNNCKRKLNCSCPPGKSCLANFGCNRACLSVQPRCPDGCNCGAILVEPPMTAQCFAGPVLSAPACPEAPVSCETTENCPRGFFCADVSFACGTDRCVPNCPI
jgi:hypothetical protein